MKLSRMVMILAAAVVIGTGAGRIAAGAEDDALPERTRISPHQDESAVDQPNAAGIYEAIFGYLQGLRGEAPGTKERPPRKERYISRSVRSSDPVREEYARVVLVEKSQAKIKLDRGDVELGVLSLERALQAAGQMGSDRDQRGLREMLQQARAARESPASSVASGEVTNSIGMRLVLIEPGTFVMGSSATDARRVEDEWSVQSEMLEPEQPAHTVQISRPFYMGKYEVTLGQFEQFIKETGYRTVAERQGWGWVYDDGTKHWVRKQGAYWKNPGYKTWPDSPVTLVCYRDAVEFCKWLSSKDGRRYSLPTEARWEYCARGRGKEGSRFPWGDDYPTGKNLNLADRRSAVPWSDRTVDDGYSGPAPVGSYKPNGFWLYDMAGNVWELCEDDYDPRAYRGTEGAVATDPVVSKRGGGKVVRGGNWAFGAGIARNAFRFGIDADLCVDICGFRVTAEAPADAVKPAVPPEDAGPTADAEATDVGRVIDRIKNLVASGRRAEARRVADSFLQSQSGRASHEGAGLDLVKSVLDSLIDVGEKKELESFTNSLGMRMVRIPAGAFVMGSSESDIAWAMATLAQEQPVSLENEYPFHKVRLSRPYFMAATEVTVAQFRKFVEETGYITDAEDAGGGQVYDTAQNRFVRKEGISWKNPGWATEDAQPVAVISYYDAQAFCDWLSAKEKLPYKLPTEAQWECACRGGLPSGQFPWGDSLPDGRRANYADRSTDFRWRDRYVNDGHKYVAPVGSYQANAYGLYDMAGNVLEWVRDFYGEDYYRFTPEIDPEGPGQGETRVMKGGEWTFGPVNLRCAFRGWSRPELGFFNSGFRVAIDLSSPRRIFHFSRNFLSREWSPGTDQRHVTQALAKEKEREAQVARVTPSSPPEPEIRLLDPPAIRGVKVLAFTPKSDGRSAGIAIGDVIIEYNGQRELTAARLIALTAEAKKTKARPTIVVIREGYEYSLRAAPGFLGITLVNTMIRGPFKKPQQAPPREPDKREKKPDSLDWT